MGVSTRPEAPDPDGGLDVGARAGARHAGRLALLFAPTLAPLLPLLFALLTVPWIDTAEAAAQRGILVRALDLRTQEIVASTFAAFGGTAGLAAGGLALCLAWLVLLGLARAWRPRVIVASLVARVGGPRRAVAVVLLLAAGATLAVELSAMSLGSSVDAATAVSPMDWHSLVATATCQLLVLLALGLVVGATLAALEVARMPRARLGASLVLVATGLLGTASLEAAAWIVLTRSDVRGAPRPIASMADRARVALPTRDFLVAARASHWRVRATGGIGATAFDEALAEEAERYLDDREGWSVLGPAIESYAIGERLVNLDPDGARDAAMRSVRRRGSVTAGSAFVASLISGHPTPRAVEALRQLDAPDVRLGSSGIHLLAAAACAQGNRPRAEAALATLQALGEDADRAESVGVRRLLLATFTNGRIRGRLVVGGKPFEGRVAIVAVQDLSTLPPAGQETSATWLLRIADACDVAPDGSFAFEHVVPREHALLVADPEGSLAFPEMPRLELTEDARELDLGTIDLLPR